MAGPRFTADQMGFVTGVERLQARQRYGTLAGKTEQYTTGAGNSRADRHLRDEVAGYTSAAALTAGAESGGRQTGHCPVHWPPRASGASVAAATGVAAASGAGAAESDKEAAEEEEEV